MLAQACMALIVLVTGLLPMPPMRNYNDGRDSRSLLTHIEHRHSIYPRLNALEQRRGYSTGGLFGGGDPNIGFQPAVPIIATLTPDAIWNGTRWVLSISILTAYTPPHDFRAIEFEFDDEEGWRGATTQLPPYVATFDSGDLGFQFDHNYIVRARALTSRGPSQWSQWFDGAYFNPSPSIPDAPAISRDVTFGDGGWDWDARGVMWKLDWSYTGGTPVDEWSIFWEADGHPEGDGQMTLPGNYPGGPNYSFVVPGFHRDWTYRVHLQVRRGNFWSAESNELVVVPVAESPPAPTIDTGDFAPMGPEPGAQLMFGTLHWDHSMLGGDHTYYEYQYRFQITGGDSQTPNFRVDGTLTETPVHMLPPDTGLEFRMRAITAFGDVGVWSSWAGPFIIPSTLVQAENPYNGDFEIPGKNDIEPDGWTLTEDAGTSISLDFADYISGAVSLKFTVDAHTGTVIGAHAISRRFTVQENTGFKLSFQGKKVSPGSPGFAQLILRFLDSAGQEVTSPTTVTINETTWTLYRRNGFTPPDAVTGEVEMLLQSDFVGSDDTEAWFDAIVVGMAISNRDLDFNMDDPPFNPVEHDVWRNPATDGWEYWDGAAWVPDAGGGGGGMTNPMTTAGDIIKGGASGTPQRLGIGSAGHVLTVVSGAPAWQALTSYMAALKVRLNNTLIGSRDQINLLASTTIDLTVVDDGTEIDITPAIVTNPTIAGTITANGATGLITAGDAQIGGGLSVVDPIEVGEGGTTGTVQQTGDGTNAELVMSVLDDVYGNAHLILRNTNAHNGALFWADFNDPNIRLVDFILRWNTPSGTDQRNMRIEDRIAYTFTGTNPEIQFGPPGDPDFCISPGGLYLRRGVMQLHAPSALADDIDSNARVQVIRTLGGTPTVMGVRRAIDFVNNTFIAWTVTDDAANEKVILEAVLAAALDANARIAVRLNGSIVGTRRALNVIDTARVTWTVMDDLSNEEIELSATLVNVAYLDTAQTYTKARTIKPDTDAAIPLKIQQNSATHSADLTQWKTHDDVTTLYAMDKWGRPVSGGSTPTFTPGAGAGGTPTGVSITGTDTTGTISFTTGGTAPTLNGIIGTITFVHAWGAMPKGVMLDAGNANAAAHRVRFYENKASRTTSVFVITNQGTALSGAYVINYRVEG